jgi:hypothetical protein
MSDERAKGEKGDEVAGDADDAAAKAAPPDVANDILSREGVRWEMKRLASDTLFPNPNNSRDKENLQVGPMKSDIIRKGCVIEPLLIDGDTGETLRGTRRITAVKELLADPATTETLRKALEFLDCKVVYGLKPDDRTELICDQGGQLPLDPAEVVKTVFRLMKTFMTDPLYNVGNAMYTQLATLTGNTENIAKVNAAEDFETRKGIIETWFRGLLADHWFKIAKMGDRVRRQLILEKLEKRRELTKEEEAEWTFKVNRGNTTKLWNARKADTEKGKGWNPQDGGEQFNKVIAELEAEFGKEKPQSKRPSVSKIKDDMGMFSNEAIQTAFLQCAGEPNGKDLSRLDDELMRKEGVIEAVLADLKAAKKKDELIGTIFHAIAFHERAEVTAAIKAWLKS